MPEALGAVFRYLALPDVDGVPAPLRGRRIVAVVAAHLGRTPTAERLIAPHRRGTLMDTFGPIGVADLVRVAGDPEQPLPTRGDSLLLRELDVDAVAGLIDDIDPARRARAAPARRRARARAARPRRAAKLDGRVRAVRRRRGR